MKILFISSHADDIELCCGGAVARFVEEGHTIKHICFSFHKNIYPKNNIKKEFEASQKILGTTDTETYNFSGSWGEFQNKRQFIYNVLEKCRDEFKPDVVFTHSSFDTNQDHVTVNEETVRVFKKHASIYGYEFPNNNLKFNYDMFIKLKSNHIEKKIKALACYKSQHKKETHNYMDKSYILALAKVRGQQVMTDFAECFEVIRVIK